MNYHKFDVHVFATVAFPLLMLVWKYIRRTLSDSGIVLSPV